MLASDSNKRLDSYKEVEVELKAQYKRRDSLILRISNIYLILTVVNLMFFWIATGSIQVGLITERALYEGRTIGYKLHGKLRPFIQNKRLVRKLLGSPTERKGAMKKLRKHLLLSKTSKELITQSFRIVHPDTPMVVAAHPNVASNKTLTDKDLQTAAKSLQLREQQGKPFLDTPDTQDLLLDYSMTIAVPFYAYPCSPKTDPFHTFHCQD